jgi:DTW domain-containing protein YfiP
MKKTSPSVSRFRQGCLEMNQEWPSTQSRTADQRATCLACRRPVLACYCASLRAFDPGFDLAILVHPREARNPVGTARMLHRFTQRSRLFVGTGHALERDLEFAGWLHERAGRTWILYPSQDCIWLTEGASLPAQSSSRAGIVLIDGTWSQAKGLMRDCSPLHALPRVAFQPQAPSQYAIREQPAELCLSSLEATYELCRILGTAAEPGPDPMLETFLSMVDFQLRSESIAHTK